MSRRLVLLGAGFFALPGLYTAACVPADFSFDSDAALGDSGVADAGSETSTGQCDPDADFGAPVPVQSLGSSVDDGNARLTHDELTVYFHSKRSSDRRSRIYRATRPRKDARWENPLPIPEINDNGFTNYGPTPLGDDGRIFFQVDQPTDAGGVIKSLWSVRRTGPTTFAPAERLNIAVGSEDECPYVLPDGSKLYFSARDASGYKFYSAAAVDGGTFATPQPIREIPSGAWQLCPAVTPDERTMYFAFASEHNYWLFDVWVSKRADRGADWGEPHPVKELNDPTRGDIPSWISADGCTLYLQKSPRASEDFPQIYIAEKRRK